MNRRILLSFACITFSVGCAAIVPHHYDYNLQIKTSGKEKVWCSRVTSTKGMDHEPGLLMPNKTVSIAGPFKVPYADRWTVEWKTDGGEKFEKSIDLTAKVPKGFRGNLILTIDANNNLGAFTQKYSE